MNELTLIEPQEEAPAFADVVLCYALKGQVLRRKAGKVGKAQEWLLAKGWLQVAQANLRYLELTQTGRSQAEYEDIMRRAAT